MKERTFPENFAKIHPDDKTVYSSAVPTSTRQLEALRAANFGLIISVDTRLPENVVKIPGLVYRNASFTKLLINDPAEVFKALKAIAQMERLGKKVLVHCYHGIGGAGALTEKIMLIKGHIRPTKDWQSKEKEFLQKIYAKVFLQAGKQYGQKTTVKKMPPRLRARAKLG